MSTTLEMREEIKPYGGVSSRGEKLRGTACDLNTHTRTHTYTYTYKDVNDLHRCIRWWSFSVPLVDIGIEVASEKKNKYRK